MSKLPTLGQAEGTMLLAGGVVALLVVWYVYRKGKAVAGAAVDVAKGIVTGDNALTQSATNYDGTPQTAYVGAGPVGTLGAATNAASGGTLSSFGDWLGGAIYDATHSDPNQP